MATNHPDAVTGGEIILSRHSYGKSEVRLVKVTRTPGLHQIRDLTVNIMLDGDFQAAYLVGDNTGLLATDTMRNTVYALAKDHPIESVEDFALVLVQHFLSAGPSVTGARVQIIDYPWLRMEVNGKAHEHSFVRGAGERIATVSGTASSLEITAGIDQLLILKTTNSGWEGYLHEEYTTLPETHDRILATIVTANWSYGNRTDLDFSTLWQGVHDQILETFTDHYSPSMQHTLYRMGTAVLEKYAEIEKIHFSFPNKHHLRFDLSRFGRENNNEIFHATNEPYGVIEGTVERSHRKPHL